MPQFFCFYREEAVDEEESLTELESSTTSRGPLQQRSFYDGLLPKTVKSAKTNYVLRRKEC